MNAYSSEAQAERRLRGAAFQDEIRSAWKKIPNCWRMRIDDSSGSRPADEIVLLPEVNLLLEMKRKKEEELRISDIRENQVGGMIDFMRASSRNLSFVLVSFQNDATDTAYGMLLPMFLRACVNKDAQYLTETEILQYVGFNGAVRIPRVGDDYDLRMLVSFAKEQVVSK